MLLRQTWAEFLRLWRVPAFSATSLLLPLVFYAFIGIGQASQTLQGTHVTFGAYFLASMAVYSVANVMIFSFGISVCYPQLGCRQLSARNGRVASLKDLPAGK